MDGVASPFRTPVVALDGPDKVTGAARYTFDVSVPGMLHAKVLRSPYPHADILSIDTMRAEALPGVVGGQVTRGARGYKINWGTTPCADRRRECPNSAGAGIYV